MTKNTLLSVSGTKTTCHCISVSGRISGGTEIRCHKEDLWGPEHPTSYEIQEIYVFSLLKKKSLTGLSNSPAWEVGKKSSWIPNITEFCFKFFKIRILNGYKL